MDRSLLCLILKLADTWRNGSNKNPTSLGGLEPPTFQLTAERANQLRHRDRKVYQGCGGQKINAVLDTLQRGNTSPALTNSSQEPRCKLRAIGNREKSNRYAQRGARTHDPENKSLMLYRLS